MQEPTASNPESEIVVRRRRDRVSGLLIISLAFCATLSISWWAKLQAAPQLAPPPPPPSAEGLAGFPNEVDPVQALEVARSKTPREQLRGFVIEGASTKGTIDANKSGQVRYVFQSAPGQGPQPRRAGEGPPRQYFCGKQTVRIGRHGVAVDPDVPAVSCSEMPVEPLPDPRCGPTELWKHALDQGAPPDRLAHIEYYRSRVGPAWRFSIPGTRYNFSLYGDCGRELDPREAVGTVR